MSYNAQSLLSKGVYAIVNNVNGRVYIGRTKKSFLYRWNVHITALQKGIHDIQDLQRDWDELGPAAFDFAIVCGFPNMPGWLYPSLDALERQVIASSECWLYNTRFDAVAFGDRESISWLTKAPSWAPDAPLAI